MILAYVILALVSAQRLGELLYAESNTRRLLAEGGVESGAEHYPLIVGLHAAWLLGLWVLGPPRGVALAWLGVYVLLQVLRVWTLASLGRRWTTRVITVPGESLVRRGPYRFVSHPNYLIVAAEMAVLPMVFGLTAYAAVFFVLNASLLWVRIRVEDRALRSAAAPDIS